MSRGFGLYTCKDNLLPCCEFKEHENFVLGKYGLSNSLLHDVNVIVIFKSELLKEVACIQTIWAII